MIRMRLLLLYVIFLWSVVVQAEIDAQETFVYYNIKPGSADTIVIELRRNSTIRKNNAIFYGNTEVEFSPLFRWKKIGKLCHVDDFVVKVNTRYTLPRLVKDYPVDQATKTKFDKFYESLLIHEKGHNKIGAKTADDIHYLLDNAEPVQGCKVLEKRLKRDINNIIDTYKKHHKDYDERTKHGGTQGATIS